jgi:hypothetical protein
MMARLVRLGGGFCLVLLVLTGCDDEPARRQAFIQFLQTHIIDKPGIHIPLVNAETAKALGDYVKDYQIILDANDGLNLPVLPRFAALKSQIRGIADMVEHRGELADLRKAVPDVIARNKQDLDTANAARAALHQPPDLKAVYDKAFDRILTQPATLLGEMLPLLDTSLAAMVALADFIAAHDDKIVVDGVSAYSTDPNIDGQLKELFAALHQQDDKIDELRKRFQAMAAGSKGY